MKAARKESKSQASRAGGTGVIGAASMCMLYLFACPINHVPSEVRSLLCLVWPALLFGFCFCACAWLAWPAWLGRPGRAGLVGLACWLALGALKRGREVGEPGRFRLLPAAVFGSLYGRCPACPPAACLPACLPVVAWRAWAGLFVLDPTRFERCAQNL